MAEKDEDVALDFLSPQFDPARALHADPSAVRLPCPDIQPCDNLDAYDSVMRGVRRQAPGGAAHEPATKKVEPAGGVAAVRAQRRFKSVLHFMESPSQGPITLLQSCRSEGVRVRVWIRHSAGVRGVCEGVVTAFDKHFNLVLRDVYEEYVPFKSVANGGTEGKRRKKKRKKKDISDPQPPDQGPQPPDQGPQPPDQGPSLDTSTTVQPSDQDKDTGRHTEGGTSTKSSEKLTRRVRQLFVRGDNIVLVAPVHRTQPLAEHK